MDEPEQLDEIFKGRCSGEQKARWARAARLERRDLSDWMRIILDDAAEEVISKSETKKRR